MIFAYGAQRSGTYWLQRMLTAHPEIAEVPSETYLFSGGIAPLLERFHHGLKDSTTVGQTWVERETLLDATRDFCDAIFAGHMEPGARFLSERSPGHAAAAPTIAEVYPDARFIHIVRDGRDVARSLVALDWGPESVAEAAGVWREAVVGGRSGPPKERLWEVRYEDLIDDPEGGMRSMLEWLGLPTDDAVMQGVLAAARRQVNEDPRNPAIKRAKWRDEFSDADLGAFNSVAGDLLEEFGYEPAGPREAPPQPVTATATATPDPAAPAPPRSAANGPATGSRLATLAKRALGRAEVSAPPAAAPGKPTYAGRTALRTAQRVVDAFLAALHTGGASELHALLGPDATLRIITATSDERVRGAEAIAETLLADPAWRGHQIRGERHTGVPNYSLVMFYEVEGGEPACRVLQMVIRDERIAGVTVYAVPDTGARDARR